VSQTATCSTPASTTVGGPSTSLDLTSDLYAACERVTADAGDRLYFSVRTESPSGSGAVLEVADAAGTIVCSQRGSTGCPVTGSTSYQVIVIASGYDGVTIAAHLETLLVGTASGWASQCTAHSLSANGWAPLDGEVDESTASYCAVVSISPNQRWNIYGSVATLIATQSPLIQMFSTADWSAGGLGLCAGMTNDPFMSVGCQASSSDSGEAVMIVDPGTVQGVGQFTLQGVCQLQCTTQAGIPTISAVEVPSLPQSTDAQLEIEGTNLTLGTVLQLMKNGTATPSYPIARPFAVFGGTELQYSIDLTGVAPGTYDVGVGSAAPYCPSGQASAQCLFGALTVTANPSGPNSRFVAVTPARILDTTTGVGAPKAKINANSSLPLTVTGVGGVPATGVTAVELEVTATDTATSGNVVAYADGSSIRPQTTDLDFAAGKTATNLATVPVAGGKIDLFNSSSGQIDLRGDVVGYYTTTSGTGSLFTAVTPARILDTTSGVGAPEAKLAAGGTVTLSVAGSGGVPATGATAVELNVTVKDTTATGSVIGYGYGTTRPNVTDLSYQSGLSTKNLIVVPLVQGKAVLYNAGTASVDMLADVEGYYSASGSGYQPVAPFRILDTRDGNTGDAGGTVPAEGAAVMPTGSFGAAGVPPTATAVVLDVVVTGGQTVGNLTVTDDGEPLPGLADLAYVAGTTVANQVVVPLDGSANIDFYNASGGTVQVIGDVEGYFTS